MPDFVVYALAVLAAYLLGAIPTGLIAVRVLTGKDIREFGSGRTGGTNALRAGGLLAGGITAVGDMAKGFGAVYIGRWLAPGVPWVEAACGAASVAGHNWPVYLRFKGGAGTGPNIGAAAALWPYAAIPLMALVPAMLVLTGYASVTSTFIAAVVPILFAILARVLHMPRVYILYGIITLIMIALALKPNYRRLLEGTERVVGPRAKALARAHKRDDSVAATGA